MKKLNVSASHLGLCRAGSLCAVALVAGLVLFGGLASASPAAAAMTGNPIYWGTSLPGAPNSQATMNGFEAAVGKGQSIIRWAQSWYVSGKPQAFPTKTLEAVRERGSIPLLGWLSWESGKGTSQPKYRLSAIASGAFDSYITQWAKDAKAWGHPFFLRFDHEMNGDWQFSWSEKLNGNKPGDYVKAWRHVHDIFTNAGASNVSWVWCPNVVGSTTTPLSELYPGDAYVDWTCLDGYNWAGIQRSPWLTFSQVFGGGVVKGHADSYGQVLSLAPSKPLMIAETASSEQGGSKADWITSALTNELPNNFPAIQAIVWFDSNDNDPKLDWPIDSSDSARNAFAQAIQSPLFASNSFANLSTSPIPIASAALGAAQPAAAPAVDPRYFPDTQFRIDDDRIWSYFQSRGGLDVFGFPVSRTFTFLGCRSQIFQREVAQVCADGSPRLMNLLDPDVFPYTQVNGSSLPPVDEDLKSATPAVDSPDYASSVLDFVQANAPDQFADQPVNFGQTFFGLITPDRAGVDGPLLGLINLEVWGTPISPPMMDPNNSNFIYQRFQRGIMHYDASTGVTRGLLLADYLKAVLTGQNLPDDLAEQAAGGPMFEQYCPGQPLSLCRPADLPGTDLSGAFDPE